MSQQDPEDDRRTAGASGRGTTFDEIIANERAAGWDPQAPELDELRDDPPPPSAIPSAPVSPAPTPPSPAAITPPVPPPAQAAAEAEDEEHYVPPEPPPIPRIGLTAAVGLALLTLGVVLLVVPGVFGLGYGAGLPLGLLSLAVGLGWIIHNAVRSSYPHDGDDGTAV